MLLLALVYAGGAEAASLCDQQRGEDSKKPQAEGRVDEPPRWKWWLREDSRRELRLTDAQSRKLNEIWESTAPKQREKVHELQRLEEALAKTIKDSTADVGAVAQQVEKVERLRAETNTTRTVMLYQMFMQLTPQQRDQVNAMYKRMEEDRKRREDERKRDGRSNNR
jgi:Spy/CpxP family protein refolding chaperone